MDVEPSDLEEIEPDRSAAYIHSVLRERIAEHVFVGDLLRRLWQLGRTDVEILRSEFDAGGYDLVIGHRRVLRHVQFKTVGDTGRANSVNISLKLAEKPSGCVIWIVVSERLDLGPYLWFGGEPGSPLPSLDSFKVAKHSKGNAEGVKLERPNHRVVPRTRFVRLETIDDVIARLFGAL